MKVFGNGSRSDAPSSGSPSHVQIRFLRATLGKLPRDATLGIGCYEATHNNLTGSRTLKGHLILSPIRFLCKKSPRSHIWGTICYCIYLLLIIQAEQSSQKDHHFPGCFKKLIKSFRQLLLLPLPTTASLNYSTAAVFLGILWGCCV